METSAEPRPRWPILRRLGIRLAFGGAALVDEGLAVVVSDDRRYLAAPGSAEHCRVTDDGATLPANVDGFYAIAGCRVSRWMAAHGDRAAPILDLIGKVASDVPFSAAEATPTS